MFGEDTIHADLYIAKGIFYDEDRTWQKNKQLLNMCAYHCEQAIEKTLKLMLYNLNEDMYHSAFNTHNIAELLVKMQCCSENFIEKHKELSHNADTITKMNNLRYGMGEVTRDDCYIVLSNAKSLFNEYQVMYGKANEEVRKLSSLGGYNNNRRDSDNSRKVNYTMKRVDVERD